MNKKVLIGLGVLAVAGIGLYMWKRRKDGEKSSETKSNARGFIVSDGDLPCPTGYRYDNGHCVPIPKKSEIGGRVLSGSNTGIIIENTGTSKYYAGTDSKGNPKPCGRGYSATGVDPVKGTICEKTVVPNK